MKLSKTSAHAALALAYLARRPADKPIQAREVAEHLGVPIESTLKILTSLARRQLLRGVPGRSGGYLLARQPADITLLDVVEAIDGPMGGEVAPSPTAERLPTTELLRSVVEAATEQVRRELTRHTIADLVARAGDLELD